MDLDCNNPLAELITGINYVLDPENRIIVSMISYLNGKNFVMNLILLNFAFIVTLINERQSKLS